MKHQCACLLLVIALAGCKSSKIAGDDTDFDVPAAEMSEWTDSIRLSNGGANLYVVPSIGRIMRFGLADGPNVIWVNDKLHPRRVGDKPEQSDPTTKPTWKNWGGDKAWPWPQDQWPLQIGRAWPPPLEVDQMLMACRLIGSLGVRMESQPIHSYGVKLVREVQLEPDFPGATIVTRFERASADLPPPELAAWQITQLPAAGKLYARLAPVGGIAGMQPNPWETRHVIAPGIVVLDLPEERSGKMGLDADALAWSLGEVLFVATSETASREASHFRPGERAQVFVQSKPDEKKPSRNTPSRYVEFEFTSPRKDLAQGEKPELKVTWRIFRLENQKWKDADVVKILQK